MRFFATTNGTYVVHMAAPFTVLQSEPTNQWWLFAV